MNPKRELTFKVERAGEVLTIPVTPAEQPDGGGRIGVSLAPNALVGPAANKHLWGPCKTTTLSLLCNLMRVAWDSCRSGAQTLSKTAVCIACP